MKLKMVFAFVALSGGLVITNPLIAGNKDNNQVKKMEQHWEMVISEKDKNKRMKMIEEHKTMMNKIEKSNGGHHMDNMSGGHMDMNNTMDMHRSMIKIME